MKKAMLFFAEYRFRWNILRNDLEYLTSGSQSNSSKFYDQLEGNKNKVLQTIIKWKESANLFQGICTNYQTQGWNKLFAMSVLIVTTQKS